MNEYFSDSAEHVLKRANEIAREKSRDIEYLYLDTTDILLALLEDPAVLEFFNHIDLNPKRIGRVLRRDRPPPDVGNCISPANGELKRTPRVNRMLNDLEENNSHDVIEPLDLLQKLAEDSWSVAGDVLARFFVTSGSVLSYSAQIRE